MTNDSDSLDAWLSGTGPALQVAGLASAFGVLALLRFAWFRLSAVLD